MSLFSYKLTVYLFRFVALSYLFNTLLSYHKRCNERFTDIDCVYFLFHLSASQSMIQVTIQISAGTRTGYSSAMAKDFLEGKRCQSCV